jgi:tetratricopeptide (TPR) repeat protein
MESEGMLRHLAFFEELGRMDESDASWRSVSAGLVVMRLVDGWIEDGATPSRVDAWGVSSVREAIAEMSGSTPLRRMLTGIVDAIVSSTSADMHAVIPRLMAYGQALEYDAKWPLAADVYRTIVAHAHPTDDADVVVSAYIQLAICCRTIGELDAAADAYNMASCVALAAGDMIGVLRGRLGDAKVAMARGNMPQAELILDETILRAQAGGHDELRARALVDLAFVAGSRGQHDRAIRYSYEALDLSSSQRERDRILMNIATAFRFLGLLDAARDSYLIVAATTQEQYVRWFCELNMLDLAADQRSELQFDRYRRDLESADLTPQLRVMYLLNVGRGYQSFGRAEASVSYLESAIAMASAHKLNQLLFEAEAALAAGRRSEPHTERSATPIDIDPSVQSVIGAIRNMKQMAGAG